MGEKEEAYTEALDKAEVLDVILQADEAVQYCHQIIALLKKAGDYKDAPALVQKYTEYARGVKEQEQKIIYERACKKMQEAHTKEDYQRALMEFDSLGEQYLDTAQKKEICHHSMIVSIRRHRARVAFGVALTAALMAVALVFARNVLVNDPPPRTQRTADIRETETCNI